jgi:hypothetical protein
VEVDNMGRLTDQKFGIVDKGRGLKDAEFLRLLSELQKKQQTGRILTFSQFLDLARQPSLIRSGELGPRQETRLRTVFVRPSEKTSEPFKHDETTQCGFCKLEISLPIVIGPEAIKSRNPEKSMTRIPTGITLVSGDKQFPVNVIGLGKIVMFDITDDNCEIMVNSQNTFARIEVRDPKAIAEVNPQIIDCLLGAGFTRSQISGCMVGSLRDFGVSTSCPACTLAPVLITGQDIDAASAPAKPDVKALAARAEEAAGKLVVSVKPELFQPILELINATKQ